MKLSKMQFTPILYFHGNSKDDSYTKDSFTETIMIKDVIR